MEQSIAYEMAYGLSHELNNPLANIAGRARLLAEQETDPEKRMQLAVIVDQAMRGCEMIADLMWFARPPVGQSESIDVPSLLGSLCNRARSEVCSTSIHLDCAGLETKCCEILADRTALSEAIWAVLRNAIQAAQSHVSVHVSMTTSTAAQELAIIIVDDGPGLSERALQLAFHPYFSGREAGRGLGLGLSKARRILEMSGGTIELANRAPAGCQATIRIGLPKSSHSESSN